MIDHTAAVALLADPAAPADALAQIAGAYPDLWLGVVNHPNAYPGLLDWLASKGDPSVLAAVQQVRYRSENPAPSGTIPSSSAPTYPVSSGSTPTYPVSSGPTPTYPVSSGPAPTYPVSSGPAPTRPASPGTPAYPAPVPSHYPVAPGAAPMVPPRPLQQGYPAVGAPGPYPYLAHPGKSGVQKALDSITGFEGEAIVKFGELFRDTFKRHTKDDMDALMYSGTQAAGYDRRWRLPWLYARVFAVLLGAFLLLWVCMVIFRDSSSNVVPGVIFTGALVMPATVMVFFWEFNQARNVSFFDVVRIFFIGGALSILLTFIVSAITDVFQFSSYSIGAAFVEAVFIGFTEEIAKAVVVFILVRKLYGCLISNGLLVGAVVGTGFAVFETMGYGTSAWVSDRLETTLLIRGILSVGGHVVWAAISGAAIMLAQKQGSTRASLTHFAWGKFLALFCVPFVLHAAWDFIAFVVPSDAQAYTMMAGLIVIAWIFIVRLINSGLRQYASLLQAH